MSKKESKKQKSKKIDKQENIKKMENMGDEKSISQSKRSKKNIIIIMLSIVVVVLVAIISILLYRNSLENKTTGSDWSDKYYKFLKEQNKKKEINSVLSKKSNISFVQSDTEKNPYMIVKSETDDKREMVSLYAIEDEKVVYINGYSGEKAIVKLYYNIEKKKYSYYLYTHYDTVDSYISLDTIKYNYDNYNVYKVMEEKGITDYDSQEARDIMNEFNEKRSKDDKIEEINIYENDKKIEQKTLDGTTVGYDKIDEKLVDTNVEPKYFDYKKDASNIKLREEVVKGKNDYKDIEKLLNKAIEKVVKEQIDLVEKTKRDIEAAKNEIKADEERKAKEEEERSGLKVGSYRIKYGRYEWDLAELGDPGRKEVYILNSDKTCTHITYEGQTLSCTFKVGRATDGQSIESMVERDALIITDNGGYERSYFPKTGGFRDTDLENFLYKGSN